MMNKFGERFTPHMLKVEYVESQGWGEPEIVEYSKIFFQPSLISLHYGQAIYEGIKVFKNDTIYAFRLKDHLRRLNYSAEQLCIPKIDVDIIFDYLLELLRLDSDYIPHSSIGALYIRPIIFAAEESLVLKTASKFMFYIILTPFSHDCWGAKDKPLSAWINNEFGRSTKGGIGDAKTLANYAITFKARERAKVFSCDQVLWLDCHSLNKRVEEFDTLNFFAITKDKVITPKIDGTIINGITRDTIIQIIKDLNVSVFEQEISIHEIISMISSSEITSVLGTGTAMGIVSFNRLIYNDNEFIIRDKVQDITPIIQEKLYEIYLGTNEKYIKYLSEIIL